MTLAILTFHAAYNYGAFLQALALQRFLTSLGHEVRVIGYENAVMKAFHERCLYGRRDPFILAAHWKKKRAFLASRAQFLPQTQATSEAADIPWQEFDAVIYGSDEIWNWKTHKHGLDPVFFGAGAESLPRIAYAPSLGANLLSSEIPDAVKNGIAGFHALSARDSQTRELIERIVPTTEISMVCDPVFLDDFVDCALENRYQAGSYIAVYGDFPWPNVRKTLRQWANNRGLPLISIGNHSRWCHKNWASSGPLHFLSFIREAAFVVTNTFHGTMFALKFQKPFVALRPKESRAKLMPWIEEFQFGDRIVAPDLLSLSNLDILAAALPLDISTASLLQTSKKYMESSLRSVQISNS